MPVPSQTLRGCPVALAAKLPQMPVPNAFEPIVVCARAKTMRIVLPCNEETFVFPPSQPWSMYILYVLASMGALALFLNKNVPKS